MIALLAALDNQDWDRVNYLRARFSEHPTIRELLQRHKDHLRRHGLDAQYDF